MRGRRIRLSAKPLPCAMECRHWRNWVLLSCSATAWEHATAPKPFTMFAGATSKTPGFLTVGRGYKLSPKNNPVDLNRVGIYGTSAGGQNVGKCAIVSRRFLSRRGCVLRLSRQTGLTSSGGTSSGWAILSGRGTTIAPTSRTLKICGANFSLMVGELDTNVPPESTLRFADALIKAEKDFDLLVLPGLNHTGGGPYGDRRRRDYFVRHLLGGQIPDRNAPHPPRAKGCARSLDATPADRHLPHGRRKRRRYDDHFPQPNPRNRAVVLAARRRRTHRIPHYYARKIARAAHVFRGTFGLLLGRKPAKSRFLSATLAPVLPRLNKVIYSPVNPRKTRNAPNTIAPHQMVYDLPGVAPM